jgi:hypothetical protein
VVLGHALSMQAIQGGKTHNDQMDSQNIAVRLRGGLLPQAYVSPAARRATRARRRRRTPWRRTRAAWLAHLPQTTRQSNRPEMGKQLAYQANRAGVAERCPAPAVPQSIAVDRALLGPDDQRRRDGERALRTTAPPPHAQTLARRRTVPGVGASLRCVRLSDIPALTRGPRGHDGRSSGRLVKCTQAAAGKRSGTSGPHSGNASRQWAFAAAAGLWLRAHPAGHTSLTTLATPHGAGHALTLLGQPRGRPSYDRFQRHTTFALGQFRNGSGSGADEPHASLAHHGLRRRVGLWKAGGAASLNAEAPRGPWARLLWPVMGQPRRLLSMSARRVSLPWAAPPPRLRRTGERHPVRHPLAEAGTRVPRGF